ncbi:MAG TPA: glycosyltransferase, partial [Nitrolancea sp.]|nr:glycosyltransferase [Nitrolancea sp.]
MVENRSLTRIILCMIVKNEAAILQRCIESALPVISATCICDTGSSDGTRELAETLLTSAGIPHAVPEHRWVNFGTNRTQAFAEAQALARQLHWDLESSYALFLDADMLLDVDERFTTDELVAGGYLLLQQDGGIQYDNLRLARLSHDWHSVGVTHEYWTADGVNATERLSSLAIIHLGDGGSKENKFSRDIQLLEAELGSGQNLRTFFYLARSYEDTGRFQDARRLYEWRAASGGWEEEAWYAAYRLGMCSIHLDDWGKAVFELLSAWARRPQRAEPLYQLAHAARLRGESHLAMLAAERALRIPLPVDDRLFVEMPAYTYGPLEEISISAFYTGERERGIAATDALLHGRDVTPFSRDLAGHNSAFYAQPLPVTWSIPIEITDDFELPGYS